MSTRLTKPALEALANVERLGDNGLPFTSVPAWNQETQLALVSVIALGYVHNVAAAGDIIRLKLTKDGRRVFSKNTTGTIRI